jgi:hypothetical protein
MSKSNLRQKLIKEQELLSKIVDSDEYKINDTNGKEINMKGYELKPYIISMRGQIDFTELNEEINKPQKQDTKPSKTEIKQETKPN